MIAAQVLPSSANMYDKRFVRADLSAEVRVWSYDSSDKDGATLPLTIYPRRNNAEGLSSLAITEYTDRQLTSASGTRSEVCLCRRNCSVG